MADLTGKVQREQTSQTKMLPWQWLDLWPVA